MIKLEFYGPFYWYGNQDKGLFSQPQVERPGIYLWTIPLKEEYLVYYVGETGVSFAKRFKQHTQDYLSGNYRIYDPKEFAKGTKILKWQGMWKDGTDDRIAQFLNRYDEYAEDIKKLFSIFRIFIAPLDADKRTRERIEAEISRMVGKFQDDDIKYRPKRSVEKLFHIEIKLAATIIGLPDKLEV